MIGRKLGKKFGRKSPRHLAIVWFLLTALSFLCGQSGSSKDLANKDRANPTPEFALLPGPTPPPTKPLLPPPQSGSALGLPQLTQAAGSIFSGTVTSITPSSSANSVETIAITFYVENAIRGATPGTDFTIRQWIGVWSAGQRYRVGDRWLLFLYPPGKLGLTSCVASPVGRFSIDASGRVSLTAQQVAAFRTDAILGGRSRVSFSDFALAVEQAILMVQQASQEN